MPELEDPVPDRELRRVPEGEKGDRFLNTRAALLSRSRPHLSSALFGKRLKSKRNGLRCLWIPKFGLPNRKPTRSSVESAATAP